MVLVTPLLCVLLGVGFNSYPLCTLEATFSVLHAGKLDRKLTSVDDISRIGSCPVKKVGHWNKS